MIEMETIMDFDIKDIHLAQSGQLRIEWARQEMPVLELIKERFEKEKPLKGIRISACLHVTTETANLMETLKSGGAEVVLCASNPLSTQDDVAASLVENSKIPVFAIKGEDNETYYKHLQSALNHRPMITMDDGADLVSELHSEKYGSTDHMIGGTEETTTGVIRLRNMAEQGVLKFPVVSVNDASTKHFFDNRYGTGQSTIDGILRATNRLISGTVFVISGYGWCGRGLAMRASGMGGNVVICEVDPLKALEAVMDGYRVMPIAQAAKIGDFFVTVTGDLKVITKEHFEVMKNGAIIANSGHFNVEIDIEGLKSISKNVRQMRDFVQEYTLSDGRKINLLGEGRLINLTSAEGHPASVMDMSFANQALSAEYMVKFSKEFEPKVYPVPLAIDEQIAKLKLEAMGVQIDTLTPEQKKYLSSWEMGT